MFKLIFVPLFRLIERRILLHTRVKPLFEEEQETKDVEEVTSISLALSSEKPIPTITHTHALEEQSAQN